MHVRLCKLVFARCDGSWSGHENELSGERPAGTIANGAGGWVVKSRGDIFDFTSGGRSPKVRDPVEAIEMAAQVFCAQLRPEHIGSQGRELAAACLEDFLSTVRSTEPGRDQAALRDQVWGGRWVAAARASTREVLRAYRTFLHSQGAAILTEQPLAFARILVEVIRWDLVSRQAADPEIWQMLGDVFDAAQDPEASRVVGDGNGAAQEYLRAIAYFSVALDQLSLDAGVAACRLVDISLPFLTLQRGVSPAALYLADPPAAPVPVRASHAADSGWSYVPGAAVEFLAELHGQLLRRSLPSLLAGGDPVLLCETAAHLRRLWSHRPPVRRFRRHPVGAELLVVRGYDAIRGLFGAMDEVASSAWRTTDLSRGGVGAMVICGEVQSPPDNGDLIAFRLLDGPSWHLGIVRRVRFIGESAEVGIETLSVRPALIRVDDGREPVDMFFCDQVLRGEAVRVIAPRGTIRENAPLFVTSDGRVSKLKPLEVSMDGRGFELRVYQVM